MNTQKSLHMPERSSPWLHQQPQMHYNFGNSGPWKILIGYEKNMHCLGVQELTLSRY